MSRTPAGTKRSFGHLVATQLKIGPGDRVLLGTGERAVVPELLDDGMLCVVDVVGAKRREEAPDHIVVVRTLMAEQ